MADENQMGHTIIYDGTNTDEIAAAIEKKHGGMYRVMGGHGGPLVISVEGCETYYVGAYVDIDDPV